MTFYDSLASRGLGLPPSGKNREIASERAILRGRQVSNTARRDHMYFLVTMSPHPLTISPEPPGIPQHIPADRGNHALGAVSEVDAWSTPNIIIRGPRLVCTCVCACVSMSYVAWTSEWLRVCDHLCVCVLTCVCYIVCIRLCVAHLRSPTLLTPPLPLYFLSLYRTTISSRNRENSVH